MYGPIRPAHEGHGQDGGDDREGREDGRVSDLVHRLDGRPQTAPVLLPVVPLDVLHHDDRVVHQDADGEDEGEEGDAVQGVAGEGSTPSRSARGSTGTAMRTTRPLAPAQGQGEMSATTESVAMSRCWTSSFDFSCAASSPSHRGSRPHLDLGGQQPRPEVRSSFFSTASGALAFAPGPAGEGDDVGGGARCRPGSPPWPRRAEKTTASVASSGPSMTRATWET